MDTAPSIIFHSPVNPKPLSWVKNQTRPWKFPQFEKKVQTLLQGSLKLVGYRMAQGSVRYYTD